MGKLTIALCTVLAGCIGGRLGYQWRTDGTDGGYGGAWLRAYSLDGDPIFGGHHHLEFGGEAQLLWAAGGHFSGILGADAVLAGDPDHGLGMGGLASIGVEFSDVGTYLHVALCATSYYFVIFGGCARWSPGSWFGIDGELGVSTLLLGGPQ